MGKSVRALLSAAVILIAAQLLASAAYSLDLKIGDVQIGSGQTVTVPVRATETGGLGALQMTIQFDGNVVEVTDVSAGPILSNAMVEFKAGASNCTVALVSPNGVTVDGNLLLLKLRRKPGTTASSIIRPENIRAWTSEGGKPLQVSLTPGHVLPISGASVPKAAGIWQWLLYAIVGVVGIALGFAAAQILHHLRQGAPISIGAITAAPEAHPKFCSSCGMAVRPDANFCANCGNKLR